MASLRSVGVWPSGPIPCTPAFDTSLDGNFTDTVRTVAGADAFSPGFCGGAAVNALAAIAEARRGSQGSWWEPVWRLGQSGRSRRA